MSCNYKCASCDWMLLNLWTVTPCISCVGGSVMWLISVCHVTTWGWWDLSVCLALGGMGGTGWCVGSDSLSLSLRGGTGGLMWPCPTLLYVWLSSCVNIHNVLITCNSDIIWHTTSPKDDCLGGALDGMGGALALGRTGGPLGVGGLRPLCCCCPEGA